MKQKAIERLLPDIFQRAILPGSPLSSLLDVMEEMHADAETILENEPAFFNPLLTRPEFVPYLARWVDLGWLFEPFEDEGRAALRTPFPFGLGRLRLTIAAATSLAQWRGTSRGLLLFLQTVTGVAGFEIEERPPGNDGKPRPYHFKVRAPASTEPYRSMIERIIEFEKPAFVTYELLFAP